ncbi:MAG: hypothetical protein RR409_15145 [Clostridium sp.]
MAYLERLAGIEIFKGFSGYITKITDLMQSQDETTSGCYKLVSLEGEDGSIVNFVVALNTYFVNHSVVYIGDKVTGYFDELAPVPLIYPPQYRAIIMVKNMPGENVKVDYFDSELISSDNYLKLNIAMFTQILLTNGQPFKRNLENRNLIVI